MRQIGPSELVDSIPVKLPSRRGVGTKPHLRTERPFNAHHSPVSQPLITITYSTEMTRR